MEWLRTPLVLEVEAEHPPVAATTRPAHAAAHRLLSLDLLRGLIMIVMAWDHSRDMISDRTLPHDGGNEGWSGPLATYDNNYGLFIQRFLPHFCAPGFFFLMGIGMAFFHSSRLKQFQSGVWSNARIIKHFALRGVLLILMDRFVNLTFYTMLAMPDHWIGGWNLPGLNGLRGLLSVFEVLTSLGLSMILCGLLLPVFAAFSARVRYVRNDVLIFTSGQVLAFLLGCIAFIISNVVVVHYQAGNPNAFAPFPRSGAMAETFGEILVRFLVLPGTYAQGYVAYPVLPWIGICLWGISAGYFLASPVGRGVVGTASLVMGLVGWSFFLIIRTIGGSVGNYRGWPRGEPERSESFIISFLDVCKYPPSLAYAMLTLGGVGWVCLAMDRLVLRMERHAAEVDARVAKTEWRAGLTRTPVTEHDFPPLEPAWQHSRPQAQIMPASASASMIPPVHSVSSAPSPSTPPPSICCGHATWHEFSSWPWYGRFILWPLLTFGRVPLFFYIVHWYMLALGALFFHGVADGLYLAYVPIWWACMLVLLFLCCAPYAAFKNSKGQESLWRFL